MSDAGATKKKAWAVLAYTVADDKGKDAAPAYGHSALEQATPACTAATQ